MPGTVATHFNVQNVVRLRPHPFYLQVRKISLGHGLGQRLDPSEALLVVTAEPTIEEKSEISIQQALKKSVTLDQVGIFADGVAVSRIGDRPMPPATAESLRDRFAIDSGDFGLRLVGKDGGVKSTGPDLNLEATFGLIDQMPMRKAEMRRAGDKRD